MWMRGAQGELCALMYGPCRVDFTQGGMACSISEKTEYPFSGVVLLAFALSGSTEMTLRLRVPGWAEDCGVQLNGEPLSPGGQRDGCIVLRHRFSDGDELRLVFSMRVCISNWPTGGVTVRRGPLLYSLGVQECWKVDRWVSSYQSGFPAYNLYAQGPWNYALCGDLGEMEAQVEIIEKGIIGGDPWGLSQAPIVLRMKARQVMGWVLSVRSEGYKAAYAEGRTVMDGDEPREQAHRWHVFTPPLPGETMLRQTLQDQPDMVRLVPYGCAKMRITIFPWVKDMSNAEEGNIDEP